MVSGFYWEPRRSDVVFLDVIGIVGEWKQVNTARIAYFDIAKGIAMLCVILGHSALIAVAFVPSRIAGIVTAVCFSFHMPLFFILSGYFMHPEKKFRWGKEFRELILTYVFTAIMVVILGVVFSVCLHPDNQPEDSLRVASAWVDAAIYGAGDLSPLTLWPVGNRIGALWFLLALFWAHLLLHVIFRLRYRFVWVFVCFAVGYVSARFVWLPLSIQAGMCAVLFLYIGHCAKKYRVLDWIWSHPWIWMILIVVWVCAIVRFDGFSLAMNQWGGHPVLAFVGSVCGTLCVVGLSRFLERYAWKFGSVLSLVGRSSLALLCVHLLEDNVFPWSGVLVWLSTAVPWMPLTVLFFAVRLMLDAALAAVLYRVPVVNTWFYPQLVPGGGYQKAG